MLSALYADPVSRRRFLTISARSLMVAAGAALAPLRRLFAAPVRPTMRFVRQIVTADNQTERVILWHADVSDPGARLIWRQAGKRSERSLIPVVTAFSDDDHPIYLYTVRFAGMKPGEFYEYRVESVGLSTGWFLMQSDNGASFKAIIASDSQCAGNYDTWRRMARSAAQKNPDAELWLLLGDLVDNGEDHHQWYSWFDALDPIGANAALAPVMGNHEVYGRDWQPRIPYAYLNYFDVPGNRSARFPRYYYSFDYGPVHFAVLNTQWGELERLQKGLLDEQRDWLRADMSAARRLWKIVLMHKDILEYDEGRPVLHPVGKSLMSLFDELEIDVVMDGHVHAYRRRFPLRNGHIDPSGTLYICDGYAGDQQFKTLRHLWDEVRGPQPEPPIYMTLAATEKQLDFTACRESGDIIDKFSRYR